MSEFVEPIKTLNGVPLTDSQAMTLRVCLESFAMDLKVDGTEDGEYKAMREEYLERITELKNIVYAHTGTQFRL